MPKVSIVTPTHNRSKGGYLKNAIESVIAQTFTDWELVIVDDDSTDQTEEVVRSYTQKDKRISYLKQVNRGCGAARNTGLRQAKGKYIAFLDDDDRWLPEKLEVQTAYLDSHPEIGFCYTRFQIFSSKGGELEATKLFPEFLAVKFEEIPDVFIAPSTVLMHRAHFETLGGFNPNYRVAEDFDFWLRYVQRWQIAPIDRALTYTVMDGREHGGRDQILLNTVTSGILKNLELVPAYQRCKPLITKHIALRMYLIGRDYLYQNNYWEAAKYFAIALLTDPLVGHSVKRFEKESTSLVGRIFKTYAAVPACLLKGLLNAGR